MAVVKETEALTLDRDSKHTEVNCTYSIVTNENGCKYLQRDTYGSVHWKFPGKKSQAISFSS